MDPRLEHAGMTVFAFRAGMTVFAFRAGMTIFSNELPLYLSRMIGCIMKRTIRGSLTSIPGLLVFLAGFATGGWMAGLGIVMRIHDGIPDGLPAAWFGIQFFTANGMTAGRIGWMLVLEGTFLIAAMCAIAVRNHWGWWSAASAGLIAIIFFPGGTLAGLIVLLGVGIRLIREKPWKQPAKKAAE